ncbi:Vacuolar protein sorting-associated protein 13B [Tupaia chinensis]|uniref:Vacuolar protein sorting-associated protein 13B n=1 Tax=Tupaia chinensis TaxID=246437 RepID=L9JEL5_TUPCH|nr:Vacuolar protein sorting-associated protein 13B [Tupaia chinensis]
MLESYVTPILMSYVNRYIKNLKPSDLQLSLWGGDVVLSKLELKLDVLEQDDHESCGSNSTSRSTTENTKSSMKPRKIQQAAPTDPDLPPGYVQSLIRRVVNNVNIVINNLILKYVEDDIVLSVNITSAECYTVGELWDRAFMDISATDLVLRKVINFSDCTVCLDKRNASGKIEFYQDPLLYKCSFRTRLHFTYDNLNSKMPSVIKIHTLVESLKLSITDQQLPMFIRIMQLGIALYYGEIGNFKDGETEDHMCHNKDILGNIAGAEDETRIDIQYPVQYKGQELYSQQDDEQTQGWVSWAWSFVPAIVSYDDGEEDYLGSDPTSTMHQQKSQTLKDPIVSVGFYCTKATVTFKALMMGEPFFDCQIGFVGCRAMCLKGIMGIKDFEENMNRSETETYTEIAGMQRFGAFYMDYLYTMENSSGKDIKDENETILNPEEVASLEEYIPTRHTSITLLKCTCTIFMAEFNLLDHLLPVIMGKKNSSTFMNTTNFQPIRPLPSIQILVDKVNLEHSVPMYAEHLVHVVSSLTQPSDNLLHYCYVHCYLKIFGFQAGLTYLDCSGSYCLPVPIIPSFSTALYGKLLKLPTCWSKRSQIAITEGIFELPSLTIQATRAQTLLLQSIYQSWSHIGNISSLVVNEALMNEVFQTIGVKSKNPLPTLEGSIQNVELKYCSTSLVKCASGTMGSIKICAKAPGDSGKEKLIPLLQGPSDTKDLHSTKWLNESRKPESLLAPDLIAFTIQVPQYMDHCHSSGAVLLCSVQGLAVNVDPVLYTWLIYQPQKRTSRHMQQQPVVSVPLVMPISRRKEDEVSVGSAPLAKQQSYQASEYASSPVKTKTITESRPLSVPVKAVLNISEGFRSPEERMKEFIGILWNAVKSLTLQVQLFYELTDTMNKVWNKIQKRGSLNPSSAYPETMAGPVPSSPVRSSVGTAPPDTSTCSPSADVGTTTEGDSIQAGDDSPFSDSVTLEQTTSNIGGSSGRVSLWMQWVLPKITIKLFAPDPENKGTEVCMVSELEDLSASIDVQDVYTKVKCKIESFNIDHYRSRLGEECWSLGQCGGVFLSSTDKLNRRTLLVRPVSKQDPFSHCSGFFPSTTTKLLDGSHQQHGFLSLTYTKAVTKNVRHKLTSRNERRSFHKLSEGLMDGSPHFLHEILLSAQAFDIVLCFPLLNAIASIFQAKLPRTQKEKRKSPGQPMRTHTLTSRNLPLIYINTSVIRIFVPKIQEMQPTVEVNEAAKEDTVVLKIGSVAMAPQADNPLGRSVLRKDIYQRALNLGILRDPGSEIEDRQYQIDLQSINIGTTQWDQLKPEKESSTGGVLTESERNSQNPALEWNMASSIRRHQERRAILTPILTDFSVRITGAPAIIFTKIISPENLHTEEILVCGHSLEVNITTNLDFFLSVAQVQLLHQLIVANMTGLEPSNKATEISKQEHKKMDTFDGGVAETSSRYSGAPDSGIGSDSVKIRIIQIEQHSGASQHRIARPSRQSSIVKNLNFIPFDIFITASRISLMTYSCTALPKSKSQEQKDNEKTGKSSLNLPEVDSDVAKPSQACISTVTAEDLLSSSISFASGKKIGVLSLESLHASTRSSARQALGITIVRQPGRRGTGDLQLEPFLYFIVSQPSLLLSCHHRKQRVEISIFDAVLKGVASDYKCTEHKKMDTFDGGVAETSSRYSGAPDSGIGSDSVKIRIIQIEQHSGASQHRIARPSRQSSIVKNLNFIPFDIFITASRISLMTYSCTALPKSKSQEQKDNEKTGKSSLNLPEVDSDVAKPSQACISTVTAEDLLSSSISFASGKKIGVLSLESLHASTRSSARQALGITIVRQPGRRGTGDLQLEPFLYFIVSQPSLLLSCHHRKQRVEISIFDAVLKGVASDYKCTDPGKTLPEALDYCTLWLQTVPGEIDSKSGIPPSLVMLQIKDFLNGPADINLDISKPLKANLSFTKLDQINQFLKKIQSAHSKETSALSEPMLNKDELPVSKYYRGKVTKPKVHGDGVQKCPVQENVWRAVSYFQKISVHTTQIVISMETVPHPSKPCLLASLSSLSGSLSVKAAQKVPVLLHELLNGYLNEEGNFEVQVSEPVPQMASPIEKNQAFKSEQSSDDLRTGLFQYVQDVEPLKLPGVYEVLFYNETEESPGMMLWRYPEPRVLTLVRINPVPFNTTEDPDISTADLGDVLQVPCCLEYWDELQKVFVAFREFSLSESKVCELQLPDINLVNDQKKLVSSDLWRIVLNSNQNGADDQSSASESGSQSTCEQLVTPTALAACTRVDSCFTPWFVPSLCLSFQFAHLEFRLCHHLDQLGTAPPQYLQPFISDKNVPSELEYMIISLREPHVYLRQWNNSSVCQEIRFSAQADCRLLECRNVTMHSVVMPFGISGQIAVSSDAVEKLLDCSIMVDSVFVNFGQHAVHSLNTAVQAWQQNKCPEVEELVFSHFVICNDTQETLRFGQVDTDENVLLASLHSHQYSWRSHKSPQLLHICIEGWGNWRWSEPFSVDHAGTFIRTIQYKGRTASLIIKVQQLSGVQKQIVICGRQIICSYLSQSIELKVVQHYIGQDGQAVVREHFDCLTAKQKLPSYILENSELTELCVKAKGDEDWSRDVCLESTAPDYSIVIQVPSSNSSIIYVWCTVLTLEPNSQVQQRMIVFSPLFIMRSHLPDPIIIHLEKRSLGLSETQIIPGKGQEKPLQNIEPDLVHHLTFQAREEYDPSDCAVPISTSLIKQIATKVHPGGTVHQILDEFYGPEKSLQPMWPYNKKDSERNEQLSQWDSPMRVKLSIWKPYVRTLLIELLPWALLINQSKWDLWLFEGEKIILQVPAGKIIIPPNFQEAFQIGIYWANTNTVHKSVAIKLVHNLTSPKWKDGGNGEVVTLDEEGLIDAEIRLGAFPGHQKLCQFCISSMVQQSIQIIQIEDKTTIINNTPYQIFYKPQLSIASPHSGKEYFHVPDSATFSICPSGEQPATKPSSLPCWDLLPDISQSTLDVSLLQKQILLGFSSAPGANSSQCWSLPAIVRQEFPRQSVAVPFGNFRENGFCTRAIALTYQEHFGVTYLTLSEDPSPRVIFHNRCPVTMLMKENTKEIPKFEVYCRKIPSECSVHHELYHQISSYPDCKTRDTLPSLFLRVELLGEVPAEWSDAIDINSQGTQVVFLTGFGYVYVDVVHQCGTVFITVAPEGKAGPLLISANRTLEKTVTFKMFITQLSVAVFDDLTHHKAASELLRLTLDGVFLHMAPAASPLPGEEAAAAFFQLYCVEVCCGDLQLDNQLYNKSNFHFAVLVCQGEKPEPPQCSKMQSLLASTKDLEEYKENCFIKLCITLTEDRSFLFDINEFSIELKPARLYVEDTFVYYIKTLFDTYLPNSKLAGHTAPLSGGQQVLPVQVRQHARALVNPVKLRKLVIQPVNLLISIHASLKLYIASDHTPLSFSVFERGPIFTTARQLVHALAMHYAAGALFRAGWVVGSLEILGSPASLVRSIGNGVADFFRLPYEGLTRGPGAFVSGVSRGTTSFVKHISKGTLTSITNLATSLARNMDRLSLDEEHYNRQEEWRRQLPESLGEGLRQGLSRLGISLLESDDQLGRVIRQLPNQESNTLSCSGLSAFQAALVAHLPKPSGCSLHCGRWLKKVGTRRGASLSSLPALGQQEVGSMGLPITGHKAKGVISGVGKGIMGVFTKPIGGAAELVSQTGYGILHGAGLSQLPKQRYQPSDLHADQASNSHVKYVWKMLQSLGRPEVHMALDVVLVRGSGQEHEGCLLLTSEVLFVVSISEDTQQQAFPVTEIDCAQDSKQNNLLIVQLKQPRVACEVEVLFRDQGDWASCRLFAGTQACLSCSL